MFERQVAELLRSYLGAYVEGLDTESLNVRVWKGAPAVKVLAASMRCFAHAPRANATGDVVLRNLRLRPEALAALELPLTVRAGVVGTLTLKLPWNRLGREPVVLSLDRVYILAEATRGCALANTAEEQARLRCLGLLARHALSPDAPANRLRWWLAPLRHCVAAWRARRLHGCKGGGGAARPGVPSA